jgi:uncharacterized membrane protein
MDKKTVIASAAAALFAIGAAGGVAADSHGGSEDGKVKCEGGNSCKGQGECQSASHDCSGKNACKGKGWVYLTPEECEEAGGELAK